PHRKGLSARPRARRPGQEDRIGSGQPPFNVFAYPISKPKFQRRLSNDSISESGGFCCQVPPDPALKCYLQGLNFGTVTALRGNSHRSIVVISNYKVRPDDGGTMPGKRPSFTL